MSEIPMNFQTEVAEFLNSTPIGRIAYQCPANPDFALLQTNCAGLDVDLKHGDSNCVSCLFLGMLRTRCQGSPFSREQF
jgi:hypothetical protein